MQMAVIFFLLILSLGPVITSAKILLKPDEARSLTIILFCERTFGLRGNEDDDKIALFALKNMVNRGYIDPNFLWCPHSSLDMFTMALENRAWTVAQMLLDSNTVINPQIKIAYVYKIRAEQLANAKKEHIESQSWYFFAIMEELGDFVKQNAKIFGHNYDHNF
jgi:hypothetical protein